MSFSFQVIAWTVVIAAIVVWLGQNGIEVSLAWPLAVGGLVFALYAAIIVRRIQRSYHLVNLLNDGLVNEALVVAQTELQRERRNKRYWHHLLMNRAAIEIYQGHFDKALDTMNEVDVNQFRGQFKMLYCNNRLSLLLLMRRLDEAHQLYQDRQHLLRPDSKNHRLNAAVRGTLAQYEFHFGDIEKSKALNLEALRAMKPKLSDVVNHYYLAEIAVSQGDGDTAIHHLIECERCDSTGFLSGHVSELRARMQLP